MWSIPNIWKVIARQLLQGILIVAAFLLSACSYRTEFAVVNGSNQAIEVKFTVKKVPGELASLLTPSTKPLTQLALQQAEWHIMSADRYQLDTESRSVKVKLAANEALLIESMHKYGGHGDSSEAQFFLVEELTIVGTSGEIVIKGDQVRKSFTEVSKVLYTLTYR